MKVAIIGCGVAGLASIRRCIDYEIECVAFERTGDIGGTWVFEENVGKDEFGLPVHSSMYSGLRVIGAKELIEYPGLKHRPDCESYPDQQEIYHYLHKFANIFNLWPHIKRYHYVQKVEKCNQLWNVTIKDLKLNTEFCSKFDAVIVANGHNSVPLFPDNIPGIYNFEGLLMHSHDYRTANNFKNKTVILIGGGATGLDLAYMFENVTKLTFFSTTREYIKKLQLPQNVILKPRISSVLKNSVIFEDTSSEVIDVILLCTGYKYSCLFLDESCGIKIEEDKYIHPLYKQIINITEPTMCFLGLQEPFLYFVGIDIQVQIFLKILKGSVVLPNKEEMMKSLKEELARKRERNIPRKKWHYLYNKVGIFSSEDYLRDLEMLGQLQPLPNYLFKICEINNEQFVKNYKNFRKLTFQILDNDNVSYTC